MRRGFVAAALIGGSFAFWACGFSAVGLGVSEVEDGGPDGTGPNLPESGGDVSFDTFVPDAEDAEAGPPCDLDAAASDPLNCGACGHSCFGSTCTSGLCDPQTIAEGLNVPRGIAVTAKDLYVGNGQAITSIPLLGDGGLPGDAGAQFRATSGEPRGIIADATSVYWITNSQVGRKTIAGGTEPVFGVGSAAKGIALANGRLYFSLNENVVRSRLLPNLDNEIQHGGGLDVPVGVATNSANLFWTARGGGLVEQTTLTGTTRSNTVIAGTNPTSVVANETSVFWTTDTEVRTVKLGTVTPDTLAPLQGRPVALHLDGATLYWVDAADGSLRSVGTAVGSTVRTLFAGAQAEDDEDYTDLIVTDARFVYWISPKTGALKRVAK